MRKFFTAVVVIPLGVIFIVFAVANRHLVTVSFDPFNSSDPSVAVTLPLFIVIIAVAILGVVAGGSATWFRQRRWRRAARQHEADARQARAQLADLRASASASRYGPQRLPAPAAGGGYGAAGETSRARRCRTRPADALLRAVCAPTRNPEPCPLIVKICGLSTRETLDAALQAGADMVGFVFFPPSPRHIGLETARDLGQRAKGRAVKVALTVDADDATLANIVETPCGRIFCSFTARKPWRGCATSSRPLDCR